MRSKTRENVSKFFYDSRKASFAILVIGTITTKPTVIGNLLFGVTFTLLLLVLAIAINELSLKETS